MKKPTKAERWLLDELNRKVRFTEGTPSGTKITYRKRIGYINERATHGSLRNTTSGLWFFYKIARKTVESLGRKGLIDVFKDRQSGVLRFYAK